MLLLQDGYIGENTQEVLTDSLTSNKIESIKVKDQIGELIKSITNSEYEKIRVLISQYIEFEGKKEEKLKFLEILSNAQTNAYTTYIVIYKNQNLGLFLKWYYFPFHLILLVVFLFRNIDSINFTLGLVYFSIVILAILALNFTFSALPWLKGAPKEILNIIVHSPTLFVFYQAITVRKNKIYSRFKIINLIAFPFVLFISACVVLIALKHTTFKHFVIASLLYLPFIPYLKSELIRQLSLPKD